MHFLEDVQTKLINVIPIMEELPFFLLSILFSAFQVLGIIFPFINAGTKDYKCMPYTSVNYI